jgi:gas vesicle protein
MTEKNRGGGGIYFLCGLAVGAVLTLLFAPHSGEETRNLISEKTDASRKYVNAKREELRNKTDEIVEKGREWRRKAEGLIDKGRGTVEEWKDKGKEFTARM